MHQKNIGVLLGGTSAERQISLATGASIARALRARGYNVTEIDVQRDVDQQIRAAQVDKAFIALHGRHGEDGTVQGMLEMMGIPYTGSGVLASAMAMDKAVTATLLQAAGLPMARSYLVLQESEEEREKALVDDLVEQGSIAPLKAGWSLPVVVKPADEGSSFGISIVKNIEAFEPAVRAALKLSKRVLVEAFIPGPEVTVAILNGRVLGSLEVEPHREFYDFSAKYDDGGSSHHVPPRIPEAVNQKALALARTAYDTMLLSGAARVDFIIKDNTDPLILEVNTLPGMTDKSLLPEIAQSVGISFEDLVVEMIETASLHV